MKSSIDLGLAVLSSLRVRDQNFAPMTAQRIADVCGVTQQRIEQIEKEALRKIRSRIKGFQKEDLHVFARVADDKGRFILHEPY